MNSYAGVILGGASAWGAYLFVKVRCEHSLRARFSVLKARAGPSLGEYEMNALLVELPSIFLFTRLDPYLTHTGWWTIGATERVTMS
jgi:hypothetical protein